MMHDHESDYEEQGDDAPSRSQRRREALDVLKLAQTLAYGAHMIRLRGDFDDCLELARAASEQLGIYLVNSPGPA